MTTSISTDDKGNIAYAVSYARKHRHHPDCRCATYRDREGAGYCTPAEHIWTRAIDRLLAAITEP